MTEPSNLPPEVREAIAVIERTPLLTAENRSPFNYQIFYTLRAYLLRVTAERDALAREVHYLRQYGNKDCTAMADEAIGLRYAPLVKVE